MTPLGAIQHPGILVAGVIAAAIPILIHLLNRRRVQPRPWAAMSWLLAAVRRHQRRLKMENWLVLLLRALALLLLGLGLARVVVRDSALDVFVRPRRSYVLLLDTSYSTGARDGSRSVSDRIREEAEKVLSDVRGDDVVAIVVSNDLHADRSPLRPEVVVPRVVGSEGAARAKAALAAASFRPTEARAGWADAITLASPRTLLEEGDPNRMLVWITDLAAVEWSPPDARSGGDGPARTPRAGLEAMSAALEAVRRSGTDIRIVDALGAPGKSLSNLAVTDVRLLETSDVFQRRPFSLGVKVANYGEQPIAGAAIRVFLDDAPTPAAQAVVPPLAAAHASPLLAGEQVVTLDVRRDAAFQTPGGHVVRVDVLPPDSEADADAIALDSSRILALDVRSKLHVAAWMQKSRDARWDPTPNAQGVFVGEDGRESDTFSFRSVATEDDLIRLLDDPQADVDLLILADRDPRGSEAAKRITSFVHGGGALLVFVGDDFDPVSWNRAFHDSPESHLLDWSFGPVERRAKDDPKGPFHLDLSHATKHPISAAFASEKMAWVRDVPLVMRGRATLVPDPAPARPPTAPPAPESVVFRFEREPGSDAPGPVAAVEGPYAKGFGRSLWFGIGIDDAWNPNAVFPFLPVFLNDVALSLTQRPATDRNIEVGQVLRALLPSEASAVRLIVPGRGGAIEETPTVRAAATEFDRREVVHDRVGMVGVWKLQYAMPATPGSGSTAPRVVTDVVSVAPDPTEGFILRAARADVAERTRSSEARVIDGWTEESDARAAADEGEITQPILWVVLAILLLEPFLAMRFGRHGEPGESGKGARP